VDAIRGAVAEHLLRLGRADLNDVLKRSVFAEGDELLKDHMVVESSAVSVLPPVAGG
jgi:molybdopterin converting factor small subunit